MTTVREGMSQHVYFLGNRRTHERGVGSPPSFTSKGLKVAVLRTFLFPNFNTGKEGKAADEHRDRKRGSSSVKKKFEIGDRQALTRQEKNYHVAPPRNAGRGRKKRHKEKGRGNIQKTNPRKRGRRVRGGRVRLFPHEKNIWP